MEVNRLKYGITRFWKELVCSEDYWHIVYPARNYKFDDFTLYYLDISKKGIYPFSLEEGIPITIVNGCQQKNPITILNYGLGLIDLHYLGTNNTKEIQIVMNWIVNNQTDDGAWQILRSENDDESDLSRYSGLSQGLAISFLFRCIKLKILDANKGENIIKKALQFMLSNKILSDTVYGEIIEEYPHIKSGVLNGFVFSLMGLWDYGLYFKDFSLFYKYEATLQKILSKYSLSCWSCYDLKKTIASKYYHKLDIEILNWMFYVTNNSKYKKFVQKWRIGLILYPIFILIVSFQRFVNLRKIDIMNQVVKA